MPSLRPRRCSANLPWAELGRRNRRRPPDRPLRSQPSPQFMPIAVLEAKEKLQKWVPRVLLLPLAACRKARRSPRQDFLWIRWVQQSLLLAGSAVATGRSDGALAEPLDPATSGGSTLGPHLWSLFPDSPTPTGSDCEESSASLRPESWLFPSRFRCGHPSRGVEELDDTPCLRPLGIRAVEALPAEFGPAWDVGSGRRPVQSPSGVG